MKNQILKLLRQRWAKQNKAIPQGLDAVELEKRAEKIEAALMKAQYDGPINANLINQIEASRESIKNLDMNDLSAMAERLGLNDPNKNKFLQKDNLFDMKGNKIPPNSKIIGGEADTVKKASERGDPQGVFNAMKNDPEYSEIMREFMLSKKFPFREDLNVVSGEEAIPLARKAKFDEETKDLGISLTPGKDAEGTVGEFVNQMKKFNVSDKDIQMMLSSGKSSQVPYVMEQYGMSASDVVDTLKKGDPLIEGLMKGGRVGYKDGPKISDFVDVQAEGSKSGKQQIQGAPEGITIDKETFNAIIKADIPLSEKIDFLASYEYGKGRDRIEKDDQELFLGEGGYKDRNIGLGFNKDGEGIGGTLMYNMESGKPNFKIGILKKFNKGGRVAYKDGPADPSKRKFLKILGGLASIPIVGKFFKIGKVGKTVSKVPIIKTADIEGKPEWFDALVNKVILEGDDVTAKFATGERQIVHSKDLGDGTTVRVTQDTDAGAVRVEYDSPDNTFEDTVQMEYKKPLPDEGDPNPTAEFSTAELGPVGRADGPDDYTIDVDEVGGSSISDLDSDVSKLKEYATGKKLNMKEVLSSMKRKDKAKKITTDPQAQSDAVVARQGDYVDYDDYAKGGRAGYTGGGIAKLLKNKKKIKQAIDNIFPTGDVKYDATMAAESLVELNAKLFNNKLYDDLDSMTRLDIYDAVISPMMSDRAKALKMKKASKPIKTLESLKQGKGIDMSNPEIAEEFARFMKETSPNDAKKVEQTLELDNFDTKGRKKNNSGGVAYMLGE